MDIGSAKITVMVGTRGVNNTICVKGLGECEYAGYEDGEWYQPDELINAVERAISLAQTDAHTKIRHLYIGVPGQFTVTQCKEVTMSLNRRRRVTDADVDRCTPRAIRSRATANTCSSTASLFSIRSTTTAN